MFSIITEKLRRNTKAPLSRHALTIGIVSTIFGLLLSVTLRGADEQDMFENTSEADLVVLLDSLQQRLSRLQAEEYELNTSRAEILTGDEEQALARTQEQLFVMNVLNGTVPVQGPGLEVRIHSKGEVGYELLLSTVQELRDSGAEAIEINGIRINSQSFFGESKSGAVTVNGTKIVPTFVIKVIGDGELMQTALSIPGGVIDMVAATGGYMFATPLENIQMLSTVK